MAGDGRGLRFGSVAEQYDAYRPTPPREAVQLLGDVEGTSILEVGAGTGIWTRFLLGLGARVTAVEPDDAMRAVLERRSPDVRALAGRAESLPFDDASFDVVLVSSAWHWFEQPDATLETARVLKDRGRLLILWNGFSRDVEWLRHLTALREGPRDEDARPRGWSVAFPDDGVFVDVVDVEVDWTWRRTPDELFEVFGTYSGTIMKSASDRSVMDAELRRRIKVQFHDGPIDIPMTLRGTVAVRSSR